ncbi:MAG: NF038396 family protein [Micrococcaceae bacterium]|nr:NF038396 family protein [Micrococcaceae bacterium]MDN5823167.1 NF038396 family protein [Micrococcaceae bacterium]MDN5878838.1 NF038396 family protein [Micrococcaceae bacterium]MDN5886053.1 NF038396 family protein [Micrococcaceae bacterium]MDN5905560.1 NF038396 family protein [Micrococcaceae bacterium]
MTTKPEPLFAIGFMLFPLLALICAALGLWMIITGQVIGGIIVLFTITQAFALGAFWAINRRARLLSDQ